VKHNKSFSGGNFEDYIKYLNSIKEYISIELYDFVINPERHNLHEKSLHDSRIEKIEFNSELKEYPYISNMVITLLGEGRKFILYFKSIEQYKIIQKTGTDMYMDLITYEISIKNKKQKTLEFRAKFSFGGIMIICKEIKIKEEFNKTNGVRPHIA
jgi:hypothetical protein